MMGFKRSEWNAIIQAVNDKIISCGSSLVPLTPVDANHRWSIIDIYTVQWALMDLCDDTYFDIVPLRWKQSTINRLQEAIDNCACCNWEMYELPYTWGLLSEPCTILGVPYTCYYLNLAGQTLGSDGYRYRIGRLICTVTYRMNGDLMSREASMYTILDDSGVAATAIPNSRIFVAEAGSTITIESLESSLVIGSVDELFSVLMPPELIACMYPPYTSTYYGIEIRPDVLCL